MIKESQRHLLKTVYTVQDNCALIRAVKESRAVEIRSI
jgi:hypothetical protein